jgi:hypothetical protein
LLLIITTPSFSFTEPFTRQWLCQYISDLLLSADMLNVQLLISGLLNKMESNINVFNSIMEDKILAEGYSRLAIHLQDESRALLTLQLSEQPCQPDTLAGCHHPCDVLCFTRG